MQLDPAALARHWVHSHEEDSADALVYRPKGYAFPPARGRKELELATSGKFSELGYGPTDRRTPQGSGNWRIDGDALILDGAGSERRHRVVELTPERLVLARA